MKRDTDSLRPHLLLLWPAAEWAVCLAAPVELKTQKWCLIREGMLVPVSKVTPASLILSGLLTGNIVGLTCEYVSDMGTYLPRIALSCWEVVPPSCSFDCSKFQIWFCSEMTSRTGHTPHFFLSFESELHCFALLIILLYVAKTYCQLSLHQLNWDIFMLPTTWGINKIIRLLLSSGFGRVPSICSIVRFSSAYCFSSSPCSTAV